MSQDEPVQKTMTVEQALSYVELRIQELLKLVRSNKGGKQAVFILAQARRKKTELLKVQEAIRIRGPIPDYACGEEANGVCRTTETSPVPDSTEPALLRPVCGTP